MKTNHQRGFVATKPRNQVMVGADAVSAFADLSIGYRTGGDFTSGNRGAAKSKRRGKKFVRSRTRFHEKAAVRRLAGDAGASE